MHTRRGVLLAHLHTSDVTKWRNALKDRLNVDRLMADWQQLGARSGRMSCKNPPLQGLPNDGLVRHCIEAPEGKKIISSDLSKIEVKVWAAVSDDPVLIEEFKQGGDTYRKLAARVLGKAEENEVTDAERESFKQIILGRIFGMGIVAVTNKIRKITADPKFPKSRVEKYLRDLENTYQKAKEWRENQETSNPAQVTATRTERGRIRRNVSNNRQRWNSPIQGLAADTFKAIVAEVQAQILEPYDDVELIGLVHDEVLLLAPDGVAEEVAALLQKIMRTVGDAVVNAEKPEKLRVPIDSETWVAQNLGDKKKGVKLAT